MVYNNHTSKIARMRKCYVKSMQNVLEVARFGPTWLRTIPYFYASVELTWHGTCQLGSECFANL